MSCHSIGRHKKKSAVRSDISYLTAVILDGLDTIFCEERVSYQTIDVGKCKKKSVAWSIVQSTQGP